MHITDGGSVIINPIDNTIVKKHIIDKNVAKQILDMYIENNVYTEFYTTNNYVIQKSQVSDITDKHTHILQHKPKIVQSLVKESIGSEITKIMPVALDEKDKERITTLFKKLDTNLTLNWGIHPIALPLQFGIITAPGISKMQATIDISESMNIPLENMLGVGDSTSDWKYIELCRYGATMENASQELKDLVATKGDNYYHIGGHVDENGILEILDFFLK